MIRPAVVHTALLAALLVPHLAAAPGPRASQQAPVQATPAEVQPFLGTWTLDLKGPDQPATFALLVKLDKEKVVGEITGPTGPTHPITDVTKSDKSLVLRYAFDYEGNRVDTAVTLTPADDGKTTAEIDFAGGAYIMSGVATKKEAVK